MMQSLQTKQHKTNQKHQITHANLLADSAGKYCRLPVGLIWTLDTKPHTYLWSPASLGCFLGLHHSGTIAQVGVQG